LTLLGLHHSIVTTKKIDLSNKQKQQILTTTKVYEQQHSKVYGEAEQIKDRILSLSKPYIRPIVRAELNRDRGVRLEGSFGNEKNHYLLQKVNARNAATEKCRIFFGIMTANPYIITNRRQKALQQQLQKQAA
jgi:hypothetical protein